MSTQFKCTVRWQKYQQHFVALQSSKIVAVGEGGRSLNFFAADSEGEVRGEGVGFEGLDLFVGAGGVVPDGLQLEDRNLAVALQLQHVPREVSHHAVGDLHRAEQLPHHCFPSRGQLPLHVPHKSRQFSLPAGQDFWLEGAEKGEGELEHGLPALEEEEGPEAVEDGEGELLREEGEEPADGVALGGEFVALEVEVQGGQVVVDVHVQHVAELPHAFQLVVVVPGQLHLPQEVAAQQKGLLLAQSAFEHRPHHAVEALHVRKPSHLATQSHQHPLQVPPHALHLFPTAAEPHAGPLDVQRDAFPLRLASPVAHPPLAQLPSAQDGIPQELSQFAGREETISLGNEGDDCLGCFARAAAGAEGFVKAGEVDEGEEGEEAEEFGGGEVGEEAGGRAEGGEAGVAAGARVEGDEVALLALPVEHIITNYRFRRMYFKERENSALYKYYCQEEQARHSRKLHEISTRKLRHAPSQNLLPPISSRTNRPRPLQKAQLQAQTERLSKRILALKSNRSEYFLKVIGLNLSGQFRKKQREEEGSVLEQSALDPSQQLN